MSRVKLLGLSRFLVPAVIALGLLATQAGNAFACGGLVAPDGDVRLARATTFVAWHDGIERYMTAFAYQGSESNVGWIVPLPAIPLKIEDGGRWTLQRLFNETHPIVADAAVAHGFAAGAAAPAVVVEQVQVEALNVTVLKGSGQAVVDWCQQNGFYLSDETRAHLLVYSRGSPIFMAAKYDTSAAQQRHQLTGDGVPLLITMKVPHIWVPLEVLALDGQQVQADLYLLTDQPLNTSDAGAVVGQSAVGSELPGAPGFRLAFQEPMNSTLYHDLSSDRNMGWIWPNSWLTYLTLDAPAEQVGYDLGVSTSGVIRLAPFGTPPMEVADITGTHTIADTLPHLPLGTPQLLLTISILLLVGGLVFWMVWRNARSAVRS